MNAHRAEYNIEVDVDVGTTGDGTAGLMDRTKCMRSKKGSDHRDLPPGQEQVARHVGS
jgi:hypothetical protein